MRRRRYDERRHCRQSKRRDGRNVTDVEQRRTEAETDLSEGRRTLSYRQRSNLRRSERQSGAQNAADVSDLGLESEQATEKTFQTDRHNSLKYF